jgi:hypothetical protein
MSQYQKIEYRIGPDGQIIETVLNGSGPSCTIGTAAIEQAVGTVVEQELLPEYYAQPDQELESNKILQQQSV